MNMQHAWVMCPALPRHRKVAGEPAGSSFVVTLYPKVYCLSFDLGQQFTHNYFINQHLKCLLFCKAG